MSSKKRKRKNKESKHPGGQFQRTGPSSDSFNEAVGTSIATLPPYTLPLNRTVLRRYRYLRLYESSVETNELVNILMGEVSNLWNRARIHTCNKNNQHRLVKTLIQWWNNSSKNPPANRLRPEFQRRLNQLLDIAEKPKGRYTEEKAHEFLIKRMKEIRLMPQVLRTAAQNNKTGPMTWTSI